jgi:galactose mutarotase-like enzyme
LGELGAPSGSDTGLTSSRYANRIKNGTFAIDGDDFHVSENEHDGQNALHGGFIGYDEVGSGQRKMLLALS